MKARLYFMLLVAALLLAACTPAAAPAVAPAAPTTAPVEPTAVPVEPTAAPAAEPVLELVGASGTAQKLTMDDLKAMPASEGQAGIKSSTGKITPPALYKGIALTDLLAKADGWGEGMGVNVVANDGYMITYSYDQVSKGDFIAYDPATGEEKSIADPLKLILAYEREGKTMDPELDGTLRLAIITPKNDQVTDGHWAVKWVVKLEVKSLADEWTLHLAGAITEDMDRGTFESCSAPGCHGAEWTDDKNQKWSGVPLFYLLGRIDDEIAHDGPAFNRERADKGYQFEVEAGDGFKAVLDVAKVKDSKEIIVAHKLDGNQLVEKNFPLKLVGPGLSKKEMVGGIVKIAIVDGAAPAAEATKPAAEPTQAPAAPAAGNAALSITGLVDSELALTLDELKGMDIVKANVEHPKKGKMDVEGVSLKALLEKAKAKPEAATLVIVAGDGFSAELPLKDVMACANCLVTFDGEKLVMAMPGFQSNAWVKEVAKFELK